jgi:ATP-dependent DNA helicase RecQ
VWGKRGTDDLATRRSHIAQVVRQVFGLDELRPGQQAVIDAVLARQHTLAIMPTGAGKSLCYQVPALLLLGMTVVISPLIALMRDQFEKLSALGLEAVQVNSTIPTKDIQRARARIGRRAVEFVFTTPEQLAATDLRDLLAGDAVDVVVIDEAHCISQWAHDFRPGYAQTALCRTHVLLEALGETVAWSQCGQCDNCRGVSIRQEGVAAGAAFVDDRRAP